MELVKSTLNTITTKEPQSLEAEPEEPVSKELYTEREGKFYCNACTYSVVRPTFLVKHLKDKHGQIIVLQFTCECAKQFTDKRAYERHVKHYCN